MSGNYFYGFHITGLPVSSVLKFVEGIKGQVPRATWTDASKLHVTLKFAGKSEPSGGGQDMIELCKKQYPLMLRIKGLGTFNSRNGPRVLFACMEPTDVLKKWHEDLGGRAETFTPHLTLAKLEDVGDAEPLFAKLAQDHHAVNFDACCIDELRLYQTQGDGKPYRIVAWHRLIG